MRRTVPRPAKPTRRPRGWIVLSLLPLAACGEALAPDFAAATVIDAPRSPRALAPEHLVVSFEHDTAGASFRLRAESCDGPGGPWRGQATLGGLVRAAADLAWRTAPGETADLDLALPVGAASVARGRLHITPRSYRSPVAGVPDTHQLRVEARLVLDGEDGETPLPALDQFLTARLLPPCAR